MDKPPSRLSDWPWVEVKVDCKLCPRHGCYRLARLAHRFGPETDLDLLLSHLASDCPWSRSGRSPRQYEVRCGVRFTDWDHRRPTLEMPVRSTRLSSARGFRKLTLADLQTSTVTIVCRPCGRRGRFRVVGLIERFGADLALPTVLTRLAVGCPGLSEVTPRCQAVYETPPEEC